MYQIAPMHTRCARTRAFALHTRMNPRVWALRRRLHPRVHAACARTHAFALHTRMNPRVRAPRRRAPPRSRCMCTHAPTRSRCHWGVPMHDMSCGGTAWEDIAALTAASVHSKSRASVVPSSGGGGPSGGGGFLGSGGSSSMRALQHATDTSASDYRSGCRDLGERMSVRNFNFFLCAGSNHCHQ